jgi:hypothetical protein
MKKTAGAGYGTDLSIQKKNGFMDVSPNQNTFIW